MTNRTKLTKATAENTLPTGKRYVIWDTDIIGFGLRVSETGALSWVVKYRADGGGRSAAVRWHTLGSYPNLPADEARKAAKKAMAQVELGDDPAGNLAAKRAEMTIAGLLDFYEKEGLVILRGVRQGEPMKPLTKKYTMARLRNHVAPLLGKRRVSEINEGDIGMFYRAVAAGKTSRDEKSGHRKRVIVKGGDGAARKVVRDLSAVFSFAMQHRIVAANPVENASVRKTDNKRTRFLSIAEVKRLGKALEDLHEEGVNEKAINIARGWALTGCRRNEIAGLRKKEIDVERGLLIFDDTKTGRSVRPIGGAAVALFESLLAQADAAGCKSDYLFPAERGDGFYSNTRKVWAEAVKRARLPGVSPHTLRHTLGGFGGSSGEALLMIGTLLGHSNARSTSIYAHVAHDPARLAADRVTGPIAAALSSRAA